MQDNSSDILSIAHRQRLLFLLGKIKGQQQLSPSELRELAKYEDMAKKDEKTKQKAAKRVFTVKQQKFIDCYDGDIKAAAKKAKLAYDYARRLVTKPHIVTALKNRQETEVRPKDIANRQQRQEFWTEVMTNKKENMKNRLKASELLGKSEADFTENTNHKFPEGCGVLAVPIAMDKSEWSQFAKQNQSKT